MMGLFDAFNPFRQWVADVVKPEPPRFVPSFELASVYPPYKPDQTPNDGSYFQTYVLRDYATQSTAEEVRRMVGGSEIAEIYNGNGSFGNGYYINRNQWMVRIGVGQMNGEPCWINAGRIAWHFTVCPIDKTPGVDTGYWPYGTADSTVMVNGRQLADQFIALWQREH